MTNIRELTEDEHKALNAYAEAHGKDWKDRLLEDWYHARARGKDGATLHALRNDPRWSHGGLTEFHANGPRILKSVPEHAPMAFDGERWRNVDTNGTKWSNRKPVPAIGATVAINFNDLGHAVVLGYFVEAGWLGLQVRLLDPPEWQVRQNGIGSPSYIFGAEFDLVDAAATE